MATSTTQSLSEEIDSLLERYLSLLNQYNSLRTALSTSCSSTQQLLSRANFEAPRGIRYGQDFYDQRMQAARLCHVAKDTEADTAAVVKVTVTAVSTASSHEVLRGTEKGERTEEGLKGDNVEAADGEVLEEKPKEEEDGTKKKVQRDPIRMFGILTPQSLRLAQAESIKMVGDIIPQLLNIDAEMMETEIQIRRRRKQRSKAELLEKKSVEDAGKRGDIERLADGVKSIAV